MTLTSLRTVTAPSWLQPARDLLRSTPFRPILLGKLLASFWSPFSSFFLTFNFQCLSQKLWYPSQSSWHSSLSYPSSSSSSSQSSQFLYTRLKSQTRVLLSFVTTFALMSSCAWLRSDNEVDGWWTWKGWWQYLFPHYNGNIKLGKCVKMWKSTPFAKWKIAERTTIAGFSILKFTL